MIWDTVKINSVRIVREDVREHKAYYILELTVDKAGDSAFSEGVEPRGLWLIKKDNSWYVEGLMSSSTPDFDWWKE